MYIYVCTHILLFHEICARMHKLQESSVQYVCTNGNMYVPVHNAYTQKSVSASTHFHPTCERMRR